MARNEEPGSLLATRSTAPTVKKANHLDDGGRGSLLLFLLLFCFVLTGCSPLLLWVRSEDPRRGRFRKDGHVRGTTRSRGTRVVLLWLLHGLRPPGEDTL